MYLASSKPFKWSRIPKMANDSQSVSPRALQVNIRLQLHCTHASLYVCLVCATHSMHIALQPIVNAN